MRFRHDELADLIDAMFAAAGCNGEEARRVAMRLVESNLAGHDSHGIIRVPSYVQWLRDGRVFPNRSIEVVSDTEAVAVVDGQFGLGQTVGEQATQLALEKSTRHGVAIVALRHAGHLGRIGDYAEMAARAGKLSLHFVNTSGAGMLVAPHGGVERRLSVNPIALAAPRAVGKPIVLDMSAAPMAEGKLRLALHRGESVPDGCIIDADGNPTNDPKDFYGDPPGALIPIAGHKGHGLLLLTELLAGALTGGSCSNPENAWRVSNSMLSIVIDRSFFGSEEAFFDEVERYIAFVKSSRKSTPDGEIFMPGEIEAQTRAERLENGIEIDDVTWEQLYDTCAALGVVHNFPAPEGERADLGGFSMPGLGGQGRPDDGE